MRQLEAIVGAEKFQQRLRLYLQSFAFANATWSDLIRILGGAEPDSLLANWDDAWIETSGRPTIRTAINGDRIVIESIDPEGNHRVWPQTLLIKGGSSERSVQASLLIGRDGVVSYPLQPGFKPNYVLTDPRDPGVRAIPARRSNNRISVRSSRRYPRRKSARRRMGRSLGEHGRTARGAQRLREYRHPGFASRSPGIDDRPRASESQIGLLGASFGFRATRGARRA